MLGLQKPLSWQTPRLPWRPGYEASLLPEKSFGSRACLIAPLRSTKICGRYVRDPCMQLKSSWKLYGYLTGVTQTL